MEEIQIRDQVNLAIKQWSNLQNRRGISVEITDRAIDFIIELISNIKLDPSPFWRTKDNYSYDSAQEFAISLIPNALNDIQRINSYKRRFKSSSITISSWELWNSLTQVLSTFCFIPEDDM